MPAMPAGAEEGIIKGLYKFKTGPEGKKHKAQIFGSGSIIRSALHAQEILAERYDVSADVWSATSYKNLRNEALLAERWNMLHPDRAAEKALRPATPGKGKRPVHRRFRQHENRAGPDRQMGSRRLDDSGHRWFWPQRHPRPRLRRFFEIDAECVVIATLHSLAQRGAIERKVVAQAIKDLNVDPEKGFPQLSAF